MFDETIFDLITEENDKIENRLKEKTEKQILNIYKDFLALFSLEYSKYPENIKKTIENRDHEICYIMGSKQTLINRTCNEKIQLANKFLQSNRDPLVYYLILDELLLKKTCKEQIKLIDKLLNSKEEEYLPCDRNIYEIIINSSGTKTCIILEMIDNYLINGLKTEQKICEKPQLNIDVSKNKSKRLIKNT